MIGLRLASITFVLLGFFSPVVTAAQQAAKVPRIGYLAPMAGNRHATEVFHQWLRDLGYIEGRNIVIEYRADGEIDRLPALAAELVALEVDIIVAGATPHALAAKQATRTVAIVFAAAGDPLSSGLVTSLARPGGNVTGLSVLASQELVGKRLQYLKQAVPGVSRVAYLWHPGAADERTQKDSMRAADVAARALGVRLQFVEARGPADFNRAFSDMNRTRAEALAVSPSAMFAAEGRRVVDLAAKDRLPTVYPWREYVDVGGLMAYGPNVADSFRRAASYVDKILKGAKPGDLPVEQPTKFELVINLKAAKALGLTIPRSVLAQADHVVEK